TLVAGPVELATPPGVRRIDVETAGQMGAAIDEAFAAGVDVVIMAAAVADYRPSERMDMKRKKTGEEWLLRLEPTEDILARLGRRKRHEVLVGFAAESEPEARSRAYARKKLQEKNLDLIVLNNVTEPDAGFAVSTNRVRLLWADGLEEDVPLASKLE